MLLSFVTSEYFLLTCDEPVALHRDPHGVRVRRVVPDQVLDEGAAAEAGGRGEGEGGAAGISTRGKEIEANKYMARSILCPILSHRNPDPTF